MDGSATPFRVNLTAEGAARLRERVKEKLKDFMGDYTDDTLVEYIIVLLRNGRQMEEARKELDVFLGDDSESFVLWLWDHLATSSHLYMQTLGDGVMKVTGKPVPLEDIASGDSESPFDHEKEKPPRLRTRHNKEWKGLVHDDAKPLILQSSVVDESRVGDRCHNLVKASSLKPQIQKKRNRQDDESTKKEGVKCSKLAAPRRLLQFAVRDALGTMQKKVSSRPKPSLKSLHSVVHAPTVDIPSDAPQKINSTVVVAGIEEATEGVAKGRGPRNVFDRLSHGVKGSYGHSQNKHAPVENGVDEDSDFIGYQQRKENTRMSRDTVHATMLDECLDLASDSSSENKDFDNMEPSNSANERSGGVKMLPVQKDKDVIMSQQSSIHAANEKTTATPSSIHKLGSNASQATLNSSVNVNAQRPIDYQLSGQHKKIENQVTVDGTVEDGEKLNTQVAKNIAMDKVSRKDETVRDDPKAIEKSLPSSLGRSPGSLPGAYSSGRPIDDADSRTVFVSNVHFAATKDTLSRHFNKFGEVLKVFIATDATTGKPKGCACVEFLRKDSAELALSLNGTSFMSRILKVVMRSAANNDAASMMSWTRIAQSSAFPHRLGRMPYPRGLMATNLRARLPLKPGPRSLQWKRENSGGSANEDVKPSQDPSTQVVATVSSARRNLTYVRHEPKTDGGMGLA